MANSTSTARGAALPDPSAIQRAEAFTREPFLHAGEDPAVALAPGTARRHALDATLAEIEAGEPVPTTKWRRRYALLLGLERVLSEDEPRLADGTTLNPHQVDALSGTLTALLAAAQNGTSSAVPVAEAVLAVEEREDGEEDEAPAAEAEPEPEEDDEDDEDEPVGESDDEPLEHFEIELDEDDDDEEDEEAAAFDDPDDEDVDEDVAGEAADDPNAHKRFWFEHATGAGKTVAAMGFVEASRTGGVLILTHRRNLVDQFLDELRTRGYGDRESPALLDGEGKDRLDGPVTVETYQWFVRNAGRISPAYTIVICDEAHTALGEKTSAAIREWTGPIFVGMTATGALIARHVTDLFPTQTSRFDLAQAARRGVIAPLRCLRIPPGPGVRTIAKVPLRKGDVDVEFDQEMLAELLDQLPFNLAIADLYKTRFNGVPGVVYAAGVRHAYNVASAFRDLGMKAAAVSGETPKRELAEILAAYERGEIDVLVNAQLLAEGWNSPRATVCMHLAPTASRRIYQQRVGRVTRRHPGKESGIVVDFVHPATKHDDPVVTLHSLLDRDVYRGGAIVVGPVRRGRGRRVRVERRVIPVCADEERRHEVFERELWRIAVEHLDYGEQHMWAAVAAAKVAPSGWRRARAMLHYDKSGELKRRFLLTAVERNRNSQLRLRALQELAAAKDAEAIDLAIDMVGQWSRDERREAAKVLLQALAEKRIGRRDQANAWIWRLAEYTRDVHEEYAVARWPETKRLLGLLVNASGHAHARNARRLVQAARKQDRRLQAAILAAAVAHTPEAEEVLRGARTRLARKPGALSRELLRNFPKRRARNRRRKKRDLVEAGAEGREASFALDAIADEQAGTPPDGAEATEAAEAAEAADAAASAGDDAHEATRTEKPAPSTSRSARRRRARRRAAEEASAAAAAAADGGEEEAAAVAVESPAGAEPSAEEAELAAQEEAPKRRRRARKAQEPVAQTAAEEAGPAVEEEAPKRRRRARGAEEPVAETAAEEAGPAAQEEAPKRRRRGRKAEEPTSDAVPAEDAATPVPRRGRATKSTAVAAAADAVAAAVTKSAEADEPPPSSRRRRGAVPPADADDAPEAPAGARDAA